MITFPFGKKQAKKLFIGDNIIYKKKSYIVSESDSGSGIVKAIPKSKAKKVFTPWGSEYYIEK